MKNLALVFVGLALAACSTAEDSANTDANAAAVQRGDGPNEEVTPPPPTPPPPSPPAPVEPELEPALSCQDLRDLPLKGSAEVSSTTVGLDELGPSRGVEAAVRDDVKQDGSHVYTVIVDFASIPNYSHYAQHSAFPMDAEVLEMTASKSAPVALANPWEGSFSGTTSIETVTCRRGVAHGTGAHDGAVTINLTSVTSDFIEGTFERRSDEGFVISSGHFVAPIRIERSLGLPFTVGVPNDGKGFKPSGTTCCKVGP